MPRIPWGGIHAVGDPVASVSGYHPHGGMWQAMGLWACEFLALPPCNQRLSAALYYLRCPAAIPRCSIFVSVTEFSNSGHQPLRPEYCFCCYSPLCCPVRAAAWLFIPDTRSAGAMMSIRLHIWLLPLSLPCPAFPPHSNSPVFIRLDVWTSLRRLCVEPGIILCWVIYSCLLVTSRGETKRCSYLAVMLTSL